MNTFVFLTSLIFFLQEHKQHSLADSTSISIRTTGRPCSFAEVNQEFASSGRKRRKHSLFKLPYDIFGILSFCMHYLSTQTNYMHLKLLLVYLNVIVNINIWRFFEKPPHLKGKKQVE